MSTSTANVIMVTTPTITIMARAAIVTDTDTMSVGITGGVMDITAIEIVGIVPMGDMVAEAMSHIGTVTGDTSDMSVIATGTIAGATPDAMVGGRGR